MSDAPLPYLERIRSWYLALGYPVPYRWAKQPDIAFTPPRKPLPEARLTLITTAAPFIEGAGEQGPGAPYNGRAKFDAVYAAPTNSPPTLGLSHLAIDRAHTTAEDRASFFPVDAFARRASEGDISQLNRRFFGLPTHRSQHRTQTQYAPEILSLCQEDGVDIAVLVANCPVCHQSACLVANHLEAEGISTVVLGCARDIVEYVGAPRFVFSDLPLGNPAGPPNDRSAQDAIARDALNAFSSATHPRHTVQSAARWPGAANWKQDYANVSLLSAAELAEHRAEFDRVKRERTRT